VPGTSRETWVEVAEPGYQVILIPSSASVWTGCHQGNLPVWGRFCAPV